VSKGVSNLFKKFKKEAEEEQKQPIQFQSDNQMDSTNYGIKEEVG